jgi:ubiquitin carboxyl-terminal hydrolase 7
MVLNSNVADLNGPTLTNEIKLINRRILYFPWGNNQKECSSAYFEAIPPENAPADWYVCAQFAIVIWNPTNPTKQKSMPASHRFYAGETDWGFTSFLGIRAAYQRAVHNNETPIAKGGEVTNMTAYVRVVKDPSGVLWHNFRDYDSRRQTGYAGLRNQGATCYMNSLLQSLYFTNAFRKVRSNI